MAKQRTDTDAVINLVINGKQAMTSLKELTDTQRRLTTEFRSMNSQNPQYPQRLRELQAINAAVSEQQRLVRGVTEEVKAGWLEMSAGVAAGNLISGAIDTALGAIQDFVSGAEAAYAEAEQGQAQLQAVLKSTGGISGKTKEQLDALSGSIMNLTGVDDDVITKSESLLLTFTNIRGEIFDQTLPAIVDMTAALNNGNVSMETIQATTIQVGKALNDPIKGMTALSKVGVSFTADQKKAVKAMVDTNDVAGAQKLILKELGKEFGGVAEAMSNTDTGAMLKMQTRLGNIQESIGGLITKMKSGLVSGLDPLISWFEKITSASDSFDSDKAVAELDKTKKSVRDLEQNIQPLIERYDVLKSKTSLNKDEQTELKKVIGQIGSIVPTAITQFDNYGNALDINKGKINEFIKIQKALLAYQNKDALKETGGSIDDIKKRIASQLALLRSGKVTETVSSGNSLGVGGYSIVRPLTGKEITDIQEQIKQYSTSLDNLRLRYKGLKGEQYDEPQKPIVIPPSSGNSGGPSKKEISEAEKAKKLFKEADEERVASLERTAQEMMSSYAKQISVVDEHFRLLKEKYSSNSAAVVQIEAERVAKIKSLEEAFKKDDLAKLVSIQSEINKLTTSSVKSYLEKELAELRVGTDLKLDALQKESTEIEALVAKQQTEITRLIAAGKNEEANILQKAVARETSILLANGALRKQIIKNQTEKEKEIKADVSNNEQLSQLKANVIDANDGKSYRKAIDAQKQLLDYSYKMEIDHAKATGQAVYEIQSRYKSESNKLDKDFQTKAFDFAITTAQTAANNIFTLMRASQSARSDAAISSFERERNEELSNKKLTEAQKDQINKKYDDKIKEEKLRAWKAEQKAAIAQALINGALAVTKVLAQTGVLSPFVIPAIIAGTAAELAVIISQKPPQFATGVRDFEGGQAIVGEKGMELVEENGKMWLTSGPSLTDLAPGSNVYSASDTSKILRDQMYPPSYYNIDERAGMAAEKYYRSNGTTSSTIQKPADANSNKGIEQSGSNDLSQLVKKFDEMIAAQKEANDKKVIQVYTEFEDFQNNVIKTRISQGG